MTESKKQELRDLLSEIADATAQYGTMMFEGNGLGASFYLGKVVRTTNKIEVLFDEWTRCCGSSEETGIQGVE